MTRIKGKTNKLPKIAIIGGGLAGTACAYVLGRRGFAPIIYEASNSLASGASGNDWGLYNPRISAQLSPHGWYYKAAFEQALTTFSNLKNIDHNVCGAVHLITDEKKHIRYTKALKNWGWAPDMMSILSAAHASKIAGIALNYDALYLPHSGYVSPRKLCYEYARGVKIHLNTPIKSLNHVNADIIIIANGMGALKFESCATLPLRPVRGQTTCVSANEASKRLKTAICYGGYCLPAVGETHMIGATFERGMKTPTIKDNDDVYNIEKLNAAVPTLQLNAIQAHWAGIRTTSRHHTPIIKRLNDSTYISTAHGSHGIISTIKAAHMIADNIEKNMPIRVL